MVPAAGITGYHRKVPKTKGDMTFGPYPQRRVVAQVEALAGTRGFPEGKQVAGLLNAEPNWWTRRRKCETPLTLAEISTLAEKLGAPPGWPFLDGHMRQALAVGLAELAKKEAAANPSRTSQEAARPGEEEAPGELAHVIPLFPGK